METLVEASYSPAGRPKAELLARANRELEVLRWLLRLARERELLTARQVRFYSPFSFLLSPCSCQPPESRRPCQTARTRMSSFARIS